MKKYSQYGVEDFVLDDGFRMWVLNQVPHHDSFWRDWIISHPGMKPVAEEARVIILGLQDQPARVSQQEIEAGFQEVEAYFEKANSPQRSWLAGSTWWIAASVLALVLTGIGMIFQDQPREEEKLFVTEAGQHDKIQLPDGSRVYMEENSRLTFVDNWNENQTRKVTLQGEAYFQVSEQVYEGEKVKFVVQAQGLSVEVVGTEFVVQNRGSKTRVALNTGKIRLRVEGNSQALNMIPGDVIEYDAATAKLSNHRKNEDAGKAWLKNFEETEQASDRTRSRGSSSKVGVTRGIRLESGSSYGNHSGGSDNQSQQIVPSSDPTNPSTSDDGRKGAPGATDGNLRIYGSSGSSHKHGGSMAGENPHYITQPPAPAKNAASGNLGEVTQKGEGNTAYIEQIGDNLTSRQDQSGSSNQASASVQGQKDSNDELGWSTWQQQQGSGNVSIFNIVESYNSNMYSRQQGHNNQVQAASQGENNQAVILQEGLENQVLIEQYGISNEAAGMDPLEPGILQRGSFNEARIIQQGTGNQTRNIQHGQNNKIQVNQKEK